MNCSIWIWFRSILVSAVALTQVERIDSTVPATLEQSGSAFAFRRAEIGQTERAKWTLRSTDDAMEKARMDLGIDGTRTRRVVAQTLIVNEDNTPFLRSQIVDRPLWHVAVEDWASGYIPEAHAGEVATTQPLEALFDPLNGHLLKVQTRWPPGIPIIAPEPNAESAVRQMSANSEAYLGWGPEPPTMSFIDALGAIARNGRDPWSARQISGVWVLWSILGKHPKPVWVITLRGIPPVRQHDDLSLDLLNHMRYIVDPETRTWIRATTTPQPDSRDILPPNSENPMGLPVPKEKR